MSIDPFTGRNPSYCFVDFKSAEDASRAMETLQGATIRDRPVKIKPKTQRKELSRRLPTKTYDRGWRAQEAQTEHVDESAYVFDRWRRHDAREHWIGPTEERRRVYVGGLPRIPNQDVVNLEMRRLFRDFEIQAVSKLVSPRDKGIQSRLGSHYYCFVDFASAKEAETAVTLLNGKSNDHGGAYEIDIANSKAERKVTREQGDLIRELSPDVPATQPPTRRLMESNWRKRD